MKTNVILLISFWVSSFALFGQAQTSETLNKIETAKIALISSRLQLSPEQAQQFWPIYNEYFNKQKEARMVYNDARKMIDPKKASEEENKRLLELGLEVKENQLAIERNYSGKMLNVISSRQMMELRGAESDFRKMLVERVRTNSQAKQRINNQRLKQQRNN
ncbi:MAG: uncharacterized DUF497 family protein [Cyclobacteriaceae bacterium]|jgi:uncharacterized DUF497 family protein